MTIFSVNVVPEIFSFLFDSRRWAMVSAGESLQIFTAVYAVNENRQIIWLCRFVKYCNVI